MWKSIIITAAGFLFLLSLWLLIRFDDDSLKPAEFVEVSFHDLEGWSSDQQASAFTAFKKSCAVFLSQPAIKKIIPERLGGQAQDWKTPCGKAKNRVHITDIEARNFFEQNFTAFSYIKDTEGLFTGYFAPEYSGSDKPTADYTYPLYAVPEGLKILDLGKFSSSLAGKSIVGEVENGEFVPYKDRENIDNGALNDQKLEMVWLKDPVDAFFMHIQGSGVIRYENGDRKLFGYAGKNGRAYHAIGKFLIQSGEIAQEDMSMQAIRAWIADNPLQAKALMWKNPSYVFFRTLEKEAPVGSMNVELTAGRSLAVDREYVPLGMPIWLDLKPSKAEDSPIRRLVIAQDTGGAIRGRVRADVYWGIGDEAGRMAGPMKDQGRYYFLLPNILAKRLRMESGVSP